MNKKLLLPVLMVTMCAAGYAQPTTEQRIQDSVLGWWGPNKYDHGFKPTTDPVMKRRIEILDLLVDWVHKSYTPVGGLGTTVRWAGNGVRYGVNVGTWNVSTRKEWLDAAGHFRPIPEEHTDFNIDANTIPAAYEIYFINQPGGDSYFTWEPDGYIDNSTTERSRKGADPKVHPNVYQYPTVVNEWVTIFLTPNHQLPIKPVSKRELLDAAEAGLQREIDKNRKESEEHWPGNTKAINEAVAYFAKEVDKYRENIRQLRIKHAATLEQQAVVSDLQMDFRSFRTDPDIFEPGVKANQWNQKYGVWKTDVALQAKCKTATPQWLAVYVPYRTRADGNAQYEMYRAVTENINYDYIYNYFFEPEKVKGVPYTPHNEQQWKLRLDAHRNRYKNDAAATATLKAHLPEGAVLYDDFSRNAVGTKPYGWYMSSFGNPNTVAKPDGTGTWLKMGYNNKLTSTTLATLPQNFSVQYDVLTDGFTGMDGGRIVFRAAGKHKRADGVVATAELKVEITAGLAASLRAGHNYRGRLVAYVRCTPTTMDYNNQGGNATVAQGVFTDEKRKVHVEVRKQGSKLTVLLDGKLVADSDGFKSVHGKDCGDCAIPSDIVFTSYEFENLTQDAGTVGAYITNVCILSLP